MRLPNATRRQLRARLTRTENCLRDVLRWISDREIHFNSHGADTPENDDYRRLRQLRARVHRTLPPNLPFGLNKKS